MRVNTFVFQRFADFLPDGFNLADTISTADDKIIGKRTDFSDVQQNNIFSLLACGSLYRPPGDLYRFQNSLLQSSFTDNYIIDYTIFVDAYSFIITAGESGILPVRIVVIKPLKSEPGLLR